MPISRSTTLLPSQAIEAGSLANDDAAEWDHRFIYTHIGDAVWIGQKGSALVIENTSINDDPPDGPTTTPIRVRLARGAVVRMRH
jgi:hypothetical protein